MRLTPRGHKAFSRRPPAEAFAQELFFSYPSLLGQYFNQGATGVESL